MSAWFVPKRSLGQVLGQMLEGLQVYGVQTEGEHLRLTPMPAAEFIPPPCRAVEPLKVLFLRAREDLGDAFGEGQPGQCPPRAVLGVTACDLAALKILDSVFLGGTLVDPFYEARRKNTLLLSVDCTAPREVCFCTFTGGKPYPAEGYDLNLSPLKGGYVMEAGSERGEAAAGKAAAALEPASSQHMQQRDRARAEALERVRKNCAEAGLEMVPDLQERVRQSRRLGLWEQLAEKCVECAACNFVCPTCHCFLLVDLQAKSGWRRFKNWDACLYRGFALEASGANPRPRRAHRLHGRMEKKFDFIPANTGAWGCVGCGRCVEACAGQIDVRETLRELINA